VHRVDRLNPVDVGYCGGVLQGGRHGVRALGVENAVVSRLHSGSSRLEAGQLLW
jgi:hypothetical protein